MENKNIYLVGETGFVGSNLMDTYSAFSMTANSKTVKSMYGARPDILVYAGVTGTKWYALNHETEDKNVIAGAKKNIININPRKLILISTVDVYDTLENVDETHKNNQQQLNIYGKNRFLLEEWVKENLDDYHIVRLPAIYGKNLKKNFIYDLIHIIPQVLTEEKIKTIENEIINVREFYEKDKEGFYHLIKLSKQQYVQLRNKFWNIKNNALMFTNDSSEYQFYNLQKLWEHILLIVENKIKVTNLVTEPVSAGEVYMHIYDKERYHNSSVVEIRYHIFSQYALPLIGTKNYFYSKEEVLKDLKKYVMGFQQE